MCLLDNEHVSGNGTYEHQGYIHSSLAGIVKISEKTENAVKVILEKIYILSLSRLRLYYSNSALFQRNLVEVHGINEQSIVPSPGDIVTAKVYFFVV